MVIRKSDRVSTVLRADESLIDVFVALSPAFERLRSAGMGKVMARLVTVEQAARMAGVDADELVERLNAGGAPDVPAQEGGAPGAHAPAGDAAEAPASGPTVGAELPAALTALPPDAIVDVDVREDLRSGREPFSRIMAARRELPPGGVLRLRAIFEPVPLYAAMEKQGLTHHTERLGPEDWRVWFYAAERGAAGNPRATGDADHLPEAQPVHATDAGEEAGAVVVLDVRGLEPPEPMVRTLAALEALPADGTLVQVNVRVPRFLLPHLEQRGFTYEVREQEPDLVRVFIRRARPE